MNSVIESLQKESNLEPDLINSDVAHLFIHENKVLGLKSLPGLSVIPKEIKDGVCLDLILDEGVVISKPVHLCFGVLPEEGIQKIFLNAKIGKNSKIYIFAHCTFPSAVNVLHKMEGNILIGEGASFVYSERHIHGDKGGAHVFPNLKVKIEKKGYFKSDFELLKGRTGELNIVYETLCGPESVLEMDARINAKETDSIKIDETGILEGIRSRGVLTTRVALRDNAVSEVRTKLVALAAETVGHVDCKEIVQDKSRAVAIPVVDVQHPKARITHEAAIGSVDSRQLETLMARGLTEEQAIDLIIQGLLRKPNLSIGD